MVNEAGKFYRKMFFGMMLRNILLVDRQNSYYFIILLQNTSESVKNIGIMTSTLVRSVFTV